MTYEIRDGKMVDLETGEIYNYGDITRKMQSTIKNVKDLCDKRPYVKGNYTLLTFYYWHDIEAHICGIKYEGNFKRLLRLTSPETIDRAYRKLKEQIPEYKATTKTEIERVALEQEYRKYFANDGGALVPYL